MDGVLVDNKDIHIEAFEKFCTLYGVTGWEDKVLNTMGMGNDDIMRMMLPEDILIKHSLKEWGEIKEAIYRDIYESRIVEVEGLTALLESLRDNGIRCAVGSSGCKDNVEFVLDRCHIGEFFDVKISGDDVTRCKPDPEIYLTAARKSNVDPSECLVFEDAKKGIEAARKAGMHVVALATSLSREELADADVDMIIDNFAQIAIDDLKRLFN